MAAALFVCLAAPAQGQADQSGGVGLQTYAPGARAKLSHGRAIPPENAPPKVIRAIRAANRIAKGRPYCMGGGHGRWQSRCYDCSGSVSYALGKPGARLIDVPMVSGAFSNWERRGRGRWITVYANGGHAYAVIAGLRFDTSMTAGDGPGWSKVQRSARGFSVRHPTGL
jgi:hypothetical protein